MTPLNLAKPMATLDPNLTNLRMAILQMTLQSLGGPNGIPEDVSTDNILDRAYKIEAWVRR